MLDQHLEVMSDRETLLQNVFNTVSTGFFVIKVERLDDSTTEGITFRFVTTNPAYAKMLSIPNNSLAGLCPHEALPSDIADRFCRNYSRCLEQRQPISYEESVETEVDHRTLLTMLSPLFAADGQISQLIGSSVDITAYTQVQVVSKPSPQDTQVESQLAPAQLTSEWLPVNQSDHQWSEDFAWLAHLSLEQAAMMACLVDQEARFLYVNDAACQLLGYSRQELLSMRVGDVAPDFPPEAWPEHWQEVKQRHSFTFETVKQSKDNRHFPVEITVNYFEFNGGEYNFVLVRDITNCKQAEEALSEEQGLLSTLIDNAPIGIISTDECGRILFVNRAFEGICGYSSEELVGQVPPYPYWGLADLDQINQEFGLAMTGQKNQIELWFTRKNGERFLARLQPITIFDKQGKMLRHLATMEDITKYKQAEEELFKALEAERELNAFKSRFLAMVSHEYRNPLTSILSSAELLERYIHQFTEEKRLKHYRRIQTSVYVLTQLVSDVLTLSKIEAGKQEFNPSPLDLEAFCRELVENLQLTIGNQHHLIFTSQSEGKPEPSVTLMANTYMDAKLLEYILTHVFSNAIKYSAQGSTVKLDLVFDQSQAILCIQDQGRGIPVEDQPHLFESFYRGRNVGTISGTGLGLAIVKSSVDLHRGQIRVESVVGSGTTVTVTLPLNSLPN